MVRSHEILDSPPTSQMHRKRFFVAITLAAGLTGAACVFPPAAGGAIVCYTAAINEARQIPEMNPPPLEQPQSQ